MPRIRSIKPEFPQSESMGRVSREARLLFVLLWTICDDSGRSRASSRMLASVLYPYDGDISTQIDGWLRELEREQCLFLYEIEGSHYLEVKNWNKHQKIDHPSKSGFPERRDVLATTRDGLASVSETLGLDRKGRERIGGEGKGGEGNARATPSRSKKLEKGFTVPAEWIAKAKAERKKLGLPDASIEVEAVTFVTHALSTARESFDFEQAFVQWCMKAHDAKPVNGSGYKFGKPPADAEMPETPWKQRVALWRKSGNWPLTWGPKPGDSGCQAPKELLA